MMMYGLAGPWGWGAMVLGMVIHVAFAVMIVLSTIWLFKTLFRSKDDAATAGKAEAILAQRYAKGEISLEEYQTMKQNLSTL